MIMSRKQLLPAGILLVLLQMATGPQRVSAAVTAGIFCNGDQGNNMGSATDASGLTTSQINAFRASGMTTMILFNMSIASNGDFSYDGQTICSGGSYTGPSNWGSLLSQCEAAPSGINRIEMCLGGAGDTSWTNIKNLIAANGVNSGTVLYQNLSALKNALGINAIDSDDEVTYDSGSAISFGQMCADVGLHLTLCPYTDAGYWQAVQSGLGSSICDRVYLQCYSGGAGNDPATWAGYLGVPVSRIIPGYWDYERDTDFLTNMLAWSKEGCGGGWLWPSCGQCTPPAGPPEMSQYADWILNSCDPLNDDCGFETPSIGAGNHQYNPSGAAWSFSGASPNGSGIAANGSAFSNPNAPEGVQAAFVQEYGTISQAISGFTPGTHYVVFFSAAERPDNGVVSLGGESWNVTIDGTVIGSYNPGTGATSYQNYAAAFTATATNETLAFVGTDLAGGDNTVFIDSVRFTPGLPPENPTVATNTLPATAADVVGSQESFTAVFTATIPMTYQWQKISGGVTNNIPGATNTTLTLSNLQLTNTASYQLQASNAFGMAVSTPSSLTVSSVPAPVNNVIISPAAQTGTGSGTFTPTWTVTTNNSLIAGQSPGTALGNFSEEVPGRSVNSLTESNSLALYEIQGTYDPTTSTNYVTCGNGSGPDGTSAGSNIVYTLTGPTNGYNLTNITVYGGWKDNGRDQQAYTVYYSTVTNSTAFSQLCSVSYLPSDPASAQSATRVTLTPASGALAGNVAAVKFNFLTPASENGYCGYAQIAIFGTPNIAPAAPAVLNVTLPTPNSFVVNMGSLVAGRNYMLESTTNLASGIWITQTNFVATRTAAAFTNSIANSSQEYFRVVGY